ncbi:MAG: tetratricopeptide repeat protein [Thermoanaerobaculia bacterium]
MSETFDVFLSHNSKDKPIVRQIGEALRARGLEVWFDEWSLIPGRRWIPELEKAIQTTKSAAVLVGGDGFGRWEQPEYEGALSEFVERGLPVIPVLLPGAPAGIKLPLFLKGFTWVDLRSGITEDGLDRLVWGITGKEPNRTKEPLKSRGPKIHNLPYLPLGDLLKGRDDELRTLETNLHGPTAATAITQTTIYGLGGIGKTRLAVEYAWRSGDRCDAALFVVADSPEALQSGLAGLIRLGLPGLAPGPSRSQEENVAAVLAWLREHDRWLLILDNVDTPEAAEAVQDLLPRLTSGHVLITSRRREWSAEIQSQFLGTLTLEEAVQFLLQRTGTSAPDQARRLAELLGGLPLALEQAAAYIVHHQISFNAYLADWDKQREKVLSYHDKTVTKYPFSVAVTWQTTFNRLDPTAAALLRLTAYLAPDPIPLEMFEKETSLVEKAVKFLQDEMGQKESSQTVRDGLTELAAYSMIAKDGETCTVHRMVQEVVRGRIPEDQQREWIEQALRLVNDFSPAEPGDVRTWGVWNVLRWHAAVVVQNADGARITQPTSRLMNQLEQYLKAKGLYAEAEPLIRRSLAIEEELDLNSSEVAIRLNNLALLLQATNRLAEAEPLMRRVVEIMEVSLGQSHPNVATALNNLAQLLQDTNRLAEAESLMRRALRIDEDSFGQHHPKVAIRLNNLAQLLKDTNRLAEAEPLMRRALKIDEDSFGQHHPNVATRLINLGGLFQATNRLAEAEPLIRRALKIDEASYGLDHPEVATDLMNLARLLKDTNRQEEATLAMRRALKIYEDSFGPDHPRTQTARAWLADGN